MKAKLSLILAVAALFLFVGVAFAHFQLNWVTCHKWTGNHCSTQQFLNNCAPTWHSGGCPIPTVTPTPTTTPTPTPTPTTTPTTTPVPTSVPERTDIGGGAPFNLGGAPVCVTNRHLVYAPVVTEAWKTGSCVEIVWDEAKYQDGNIAEKYNIYVCPTGAKNCKTYWAVRDVPNKTIAYHWCSLPKGAVDVIVCGQNSCGEELCSVQVVDDYTP